MLKNCYVAASLGGQECFNKGRGAIYLVENDSRVWHADANATRVTDKSAHGNGYLQELTELTNKLSSTLASLALTSESGNLPKKYQSTSTVLNFLKFSLAMRRKREQCLPAEIFADPAWDMLLDLSVARLEQRKTSVSSLCIGAAVPMTTALRWVKQLEQLQMIRVTPDPFDRRRHNVAIVDETFNIVLRLFSTPL